MSPANKVFKRLDVLLLLEVETDMAFSQADAKTFMTGIVLLIVTLIFFVRLLPYAWKYIQESGDNVNYTLTDVPGGGLVETLVVFLLVLIGGIAIVLKVFDLV